MNSSSPHTGFNRVLNYKQVETLGNFESMEVSSARAGRTAKIFGRIRNIAVGVFCLAAVGTLASSFLIESDTPINEISAAAGTLSALVVANSLMQRRSNMQFAIGLQERAIDLANEHGLAIPQWAEPIEQQALAEIA